MIGPQNSWEVSYLSLCNYPKQDIGITFAEVVTKLSIERRRELLNWNSKFKK
jgi:hypothetical protein